MRESGVAVVIGAGTMGGGIAADLANAGWTVHLLDVTEDQATRGRARLQQARPPLLYLPEYAERIHAGSTNDLSVCRTADWVIEAISEKLDAKRALMARLEIFAGPNTLISSDTNHLPLAAMAAHCEPAFRQRFLGVHFLHPPRYQKLVEVVPTGETDPERVGALLPFLENVLGHRAVVAKDAPGAITTRLWIGHFMDTLHRTIAQNVDIEVVDALTGPLIGRPRTATFRMADLAGLDVIAALARSQHDNLPHDPWREQLTIPPALQALLDHRLYGDKSGGGFYKRDGNQLLVFDWTTGTYRPRREPTEIRLSHPFLLEILDSLFAYVRAIRHEIAPDDLAVDRALEWGFGWKEGPFAMAAERNGTLLPTPPPEPEYLRLDHLPALTHSERTTLRDLGDGVACLEFHREGNTIDPPLLEELAATVEQIENEYLALVIGNQAPHFSLGYDLRQLLQRIDHGQWSLLEGELRLCQEVCQRIRHARVPVVGVPHGYTLGVACSLGFACHELHAAPETYLGMPECIVGLVPIGGGLGELLARLRDGEATLRTALFGQSTTSAHEAKKRGLLQPSDSVTRNADRRLFEAKELALARADEHLQRPLLELPAITLPELRKSLSHWQVEGRITEHEATLGDALARILAGGATTEQALLDRERQVFLELCRHPLSQARLRHFVETGRPLRN